LAFILTRIAVQYTIPYIYLHLSLLGGYARPPWGTSRSINWGVDNITGGVQPPNPPTILTLPCS